MRFFKTLAVFAVAGTLGIASVACGDDDSEDNTSSSGNASGGASSGKPGGSSGASGGSSGSSGSSGASGGSSGASSGSIEFVEVVKNQIVNETRNNTPAIAINPAWTDSERSDLFDPAFFAGSYEQ